MIKLICAVFSPEWSGDDGRVLKYHSCEAIYTSTPFVEIISIFNTPEVKLASKKTEKLVLVQNLLDVIR